MIPFTQSQINGYDQITGGTPLSTLIAQQRVFIVDFYPLYQQGLLQPGGNSKLEVPTAVFFIQGPYQAGKRLQSKNARLMPLAIKFNVYNQNVYSPRTCGGRR